MRYFVLGFSVFAAACAGTPGAPTSPSGAAGGADALYRGPLAQTITRFVDREGGLLTAADLSSHKSQWQEPISTTYSGKIVLAFPPNSQGMTFLEMLNIAEAVMPNDPPNSAGVIHALAEAG